MVETLHHVINGRRVAGRSGRFGDVHDPAKGTLRARLPLADAAEVGRAVDAACQALPTWSRVAPLSRARVLFRFKELIEKHADELVALITLDHGKMTLDALGSLTRGLEVVEFACGIPHLLKGEYSESISDGIDCWSLRQPVGVCVGVTPFNFPAMVPMWMFPVAIACGNTFVLKPSEKTPSCSLRLAELFLEAGLPPGVFNVLGGDRETVDALLAEPRVAAVSFVGSTPVARHVYREGTARGKRVQALAGAKNHLVALPDADLDQTLDALMGAAFGSAGERCMAISVAVAVGSIADPLVERLVERLGALKVGPASDPENEMGPLISAEHKARVEGYIALGLAEGATLRVDGRDLRLQGNENGFFLGGSLFDHVRPEMRIYQEEIFGPVLSVVRVADLEEAIALVNQHSFANGAALFTRDGGAARRFAHQVEAGMLGVNVAIPVPLAFHSFGGWKQSLFGDMAVHGPEGVRFYTRLKTVTARWPSAATAGGASFAMPTHR